MDTEEWEEVGKKGTDKKKSYKELKKELFENLSINNYGLLNVSNYL